MSTRSDEVAVPWRTQYAAYETRYRHLADEIVHALQHNLSEVGLKIHAISSRVKSRESIEGKLRRADHKNGLMRPSDTDYRYHFGLKDIVGVRIVCMFLSQIEQIVELVRRTFKVIEEDRKTHGNDIASFGYMSDHIVCELGDNFKGPRYDSVKGIAVELQIRTIAMDAWAAVSHHLDYKSALGVPDQLKRDFYALSGLFYVADTHFEMFSKQASEVRERLERIDTMMEAEPIDLNNDIFNSYLRRTFPDRETADNESIEEFLTEVLAAGYTTMQDVDRDIRRGLPALEIAERENPPLDDDGNEETRFTSIGAARCALDMANEGFHRIRARGRPDVHAKYRKFAIPNS